MNIIVNREYNNFQTPGRGFVMEGTIRKFMFYTLELPNLDNQKKVSCIPEGKYKATKFIHSKKGKTFIIHDVPERTEIMWHAGNYAAGDYKDTEGCTLMGSYFEDLNEDGYIDVCDSKATMAKIFDLMPDEFYITYTS